MFMRAKVLLLIPFCPNEVLYQLLMATIIVMALRVSILAFFISFLFGGVIAMALKL
jgi:hypothetical protein